MSNIQKKYQRKNQAFDFVIYDPYGNQIPLEVRQELEAAIDKIAKDRSLVVNITVS